MKNKKTKNKNNKTNENRRQKQTAKDRHADRESVLGTA